MNKTQNYTVVDTQNGVGMTVGISDVKVTDHEGQSVHREVYIFSTGESKDGEREAEVLATFNYEQAVKLARLLRLYASEIAPDRIGMSIPDD